MAAEDPPQFTTGRLEACSRDYGFAAARRVARRVIRKL